MKINVIEKLEKINITGKIITNAPMSAYTTFKTGGKADYLISPSGEKDLANLLSFAKEYDLPFFILGGGANILVADNGIRGMVIDTSKLTELHFKGNQCTAGAGLPISDLSKTVVDRGFAGLDFIYGMPGTVGGAVWMNARCYNASISDILVSVDYFDEDYKLKTLGIHDIIENFSYKRSPFQNSDKIILNASFRLEKGLKNEIWKRMKQYKSDRKNKGHYRYPCAGSIFKNNRAFGKPTGVIIESLGLKGFSKGGARIADFHGNIIINTGHASSKDIRSIIEYTQKAAYDELGLKLEPEIQFIGDWD